MMSHSFLLSDERHLADDFVFPSQFMSPPNVDTGEKRLALGMIESAVNDLRTGDRASGTRAIELREDAYKWLFNDEADDGRPRISFEDACGVLGWSVSSFRKRLRAKMKDER